MEALITRSRHFVLAASVLVLTTAGCEGIAGNDYRGQPLFSFEGRVDSYVAPTGAGGPFRVSLFWSPTRSTDVQTAPLVEQSSVSVTVTFPATFQLSVFHPPEQQHLPGDALGYGVGLILAYQDANGDGRYQPAERVGGAETRILLYAPHTLSASESPTGETLTEGFHLARVPMRCGGTGGFRNTGVEDCGVPLGAACAPGAECGDGGTCLADFDGQPFPDGYCALLDSDSGESCVPHEKPSVMSFFDDTVWWLQPCDRDSDCARAGYICDQQLESCMPEPLVGIVVAPDYEAASLCAADLFVE